MIAEPDTTAPSLVIGAGADVCELLPSLGGSIGAWAVDDQQMLRRARIADVTRRNPFGMGAFPLVPFSNRVGDARFAWAGPVALALLRSPFVIGWITRRVHSNLHPEPAPRPAAEDVRATRG